MAVRRLLISPNDEAAFNCLYRLAYKQSLLDLERGRNDPERLAPYPLKVSSEWCRVTEGYLRLATMRNYKRRVNDHAVSLQDIKDHLLETKLYKKEKKYLYIFSDEQMRYIKEQVRDEHPLKRFYMKYALNVDNNPVIEEISPGQYQDKHGIKYVKLQ